MVWRGVRNVVYELCGMTCASYKTRGGYLAQRRQVKELGKIAKSEDLHKLFLRKSFCGEGARVDYAHCYGKVIPYCAEESGPSIEWSGLEIEIFSEGDNEKARRITDKVSELSRNSFKDPKTTKFYREFSGPDSSEIFWR